MSAAGSRSTMNAVESGAALIWVSWPSTHTVPSLSIQLGHPDGDGPDRERVLRRVARLRVGHLAVARVILLASSVWNGARALVASS